jgi:outer membrane lipoprotein-sorting protein
MAPRALLAFLLATVLLNSACIVRRWRVQRRHQVPASQLATATLDDLLGRLRAWDQQIKTINATVDLEPSLGSVNKGEIEEYKDVRAFVLIRKPSMFRMIGLYPVVRNRAFDMVTDGMAFKIHFPARNKLVTGQNRLEKPSAKKLENIRPQHIFDALVVRPPEAGEFPVLENRTDEDDAYYIVHILRRRGEALTLDRNLWFERANLRLTRQVILDERGDIVTDARYEDYKTDNNVAFPHRFVISRPKDEYGVKLTVQKVDLNKLLDDEKFALVAPPGTEIVNLVARDDDKAHPKPDPPHRQP